MTDTTYNGWTNYSTWRVNLEMFDGMDSDETFTADSIQEIAEQHLEFSNDNQLTLSYALSFIADVNWQEIADALNQGDE